MEKETLSTMPGFELGFFDCLVFRAIAQLVRAVNRSLNDPGSNPGTVESVSFSTERFQIP